MYINNKKRYFQIYLSVVVSQLEQASLKLRKINWIRFANEIILFILYSLKCKIGNLNTVLSNLQINLNQYKENVRHLAKENFKQLKPDVEVSENLFVQIESLHKQFKQLRDDLEENVTISLKCSILF